MTIRFSIDGQPVVAAEGQNVLEAALTAGIQIPHLCYDKKLSPAGNCGLCMVRVNGGEPVKACETKVSADMVVISEGEDLNALRREALAKLLAIHHGDCIAPCKRACPANSDCQGYAGLIAEGYFAEALRLLKDAYPIPASLGRVCPHPCEEACRRGLFEGPVSLAALKRFAADLDLDGDSPYRPEKAPATGKKVAVIGGGPAGLTAAWLLTVKGHQVTIFEAMPKAGGMLRYGIPEFRLPKAVLGQEIRIIESLGVEIRTNVKVDADVFEHLRKAYDAVFLSVGAWKSSPMRVSGEELPQVMSGLELLRRAAMDEPLSLGRHVAVVGGGNTAIDSVRTAIRLPGVEQVTLIYRRSREQMPAFAEEVAEAELEGVNLRFLVNPVEISPEGNGLSVKLQVMRLGAPDASGRQRPEPVEGEFDTFHCDSLIAAIGQQVEGIPSGVVQSKWGTIQVGDDLTTSLPGVFAGGDAVNDGPGLAVEAVADGQKAAQVIDSYLNGQAYTPVQSCYCQQPDLTAADFPDTEPAERQQPCHLPVEDRKKNFRETAGGLTLEQAQAEGARCLECGCLDVYECKLLAYATEYGVEPPPVSAQDRKTEEKGDPYIFYDPNKCTGCGQCVRVCQEIMGYACYDLDTQSDRTLVKPSDTAQYCIGCGQCVEHCPTGAMTEHNPRMKAVPLPPQVQRNVCNYCGVGCSTQIYHYGNAPIKVTPAYGGSLDANILCRHGRFGWHTALSDRSLRQPLVRMNGQLQPASWEAAYAEALSGLRAVQEKYGKDSVGVLIADRMTAEEIYLSRKFAEVLETRSIYSANIYHGGLEDVFGLDGSTNSYQELAETDCVFILGADVPSYYAMLAVPVQQAVSKGAKLLLAAADGWNGFNMLASQRAVVEDDTRFLKEMLKAAIDMGANPENVTGWEELNASLSEITPSAEAISFAKAYKDAPTAMIMLDRERVSTETARLLADLAVVCGQIGRPNTGLIQMLQHNNTQSIAYQDIQRKMPHLAQDVAEGKIKGLVLVEQFVDAEIANALEYSVLLDTMPGPAFSHSNVILPMPGYGAYNGTYVSAEGRIQPVHQIYAPPAGKDGWQVLDDLIAASGGPGLGTLEQVQKELAERFPLYRPYWESGAVFIADGPVRYQQRYAHPDGKAHLVPAAAKAPLFGTMCFADVPLVTWFGQLVDEGLLQY